MKPRMLSWLPFAVAATLLRADPVNDAFVAATSLGTQPNYSWTAQVSRNGRTTAISGKAMVGSYAVATFGAATGAPAAGAGASTSKSTSSGASTSTSGGAAGGKKAVYLGDKCVVETPQGWAAPADATSRDEADPSARNGNRTGARGGGGGGGVRGARGGSRGGVGGGGSRGGGGSGGGTGRGADTGSGNAGVPGAMNLPHEELSLIATNYSEIHAEDGGVSGKLSPAGADLLLVPPGSAQRAPEGAAGTFRLWIKDGAVTKYELKLTASTAPGGRGGSYTETRTVEVSGIGSTKVDVPEAAKKRLTG